MTTVPPGATGVLLRGLLVRLQLELLLVTEPAREILANALLQFVAACRGLTLQMAAAPRAPIQTDKELLFARLLADDIAFVV